VTNATAKKRTWAACACPICRFVFRVPKGHEAKGVICPACHSLLNTPDLEKSSAADISHIGKEKFGEFKQSQQHPSEIFRAEGGGQEHTFNRKKRVSLETPSWENHASSDRGENSKFWMGGGLVLVGLVFGVAVWLLTGDGEKNGLDQQMIAIAPEPPKEEISEVEKNKEPNALESEDLGINVVEDSQEVVRTFLSAETLEVLNGIVRSPHITGPRMKKWYATHDLKAQPVKKIGSDGGVTVKGRVATMNVRFQDYSVRAIAVERGRDGYLVDWESWVAWCEMDWEDLFKKRPTQLVELRVVASKDNYYNRKFKDDQKWLAVRLEYPNADRSLYGYIEVQSSKLMRLLSDLRSGQPIHVTVKVRYPESAIADNQVIIEEYVQNGWVRPPEPLPKKTPTNPTSISNE